MDFLREEILVTMCWKRARSETAMVRNRVKVWPIVLIGALAFLLNWPYLRAGFFGDDYILLNLMERDPSPYSWWSGMWSVNSFPFMENIWWKEWQDVGSGSVFWRPLPSLVIEVFVGAFGPVAWPLHLLAIVIHASVALSLCFFVRRLTGSSGLAILSGLFFVTCEDHSITVGWIATLTDLMAGLFTVVALHACLSWLRRKRIPTLAAMLIFTVAAMASKESASVLPIVLIALALFIPEGTANLAPGETPAKTPFRNRLVAIAQIWVSLAIVMIAYVGFYRWANLGELDTLLYVNPFADLQGFAALAGGNLPILWLGAFTTVPLMTTLLMPEHAWLLRIGGAIVFAAWIFAFYRFRPGHFHWWLFVAFLLFLIPQLSVEASERGLYLAMMPCAILLAIAAGSITPIARRVFPVGGIGSRWLRLMGWVALAGVLVPGLPMSAISATVYTKSFSKPAKEVMTILPHIADGQTENIVILNTSGMMMTLYAHDILNHFSSTPLNVWPLSSANGKFGLRYEGGDTISIRTDRSGWLSNMFARLFRKREMLVAGRTYDTRLFTAQLEEVSDSKKDVHRVTFVFHEGLADARTLFVYWNGAAFEPIDWTALAPGDELELADTSDLWRSMF